MEIKLNNKILTMRSDGLKVSINLKEKYDNIFEYISFKVDCDDLVTEVQNEIDMLPCEVVSGKFVTGAFYGETKHNIKVFISRENVTFSSFVFNIVREEAKLPFYAIINRYDVNSYTKERHQFAKVFATEEEMMKAYRNTINFLKLKK